MHTQGADMIKCGRCGESIILNGLTTKEDEYMVLAAHWKSRHRDQYKGMTRIFDDVEAQKLKAIYVGLGIKIDHI